MGPEPFYAADSTAFTKEVYEELKAAAPTLGRVTLLGGWAVFEHVDPVHAQESQDIDVLVHDDEAWDATVRFFVRRGFRWRPLGRVRDARLVHPDHGHVGVDVFFGPEVDADRLRRHFGTRWNANRKDLPFEGFVPPLSAVVEDKLRTLPRRTGADRRMKQLKDAVDLHALLFHNRAGRPPKERIAPVPRAVVERAIGALQAVLDEDEAFRSQVQAVIDVLQGRTGTS